MRSLSTLVAIAALALAAVPTEAWSKSKGKATATSGGAVSQQDIQGCIGANGASAKEQVALCTKIINSGKVKAPYHGDYYALRGAAHYALREFDKALTDTDRAASIRPTPETYFQRALIQLALQKVEPAKADLAQVMKLKPAFAPSYFIRGLIAFESAEYSEAINYFNSAVERLPTYYQAIYARGIAKAKAGDKAAGDRDIATARGMSSHVEKDMERFGLKL